MAKLQPVRGTRDFVGEDVLRMHRVVEVFRAVASRYAFEEIQTPIFEFSDVFRKTLGETSDVVSKEMYTFSDRGGEELTLRPEYTAGIARAYISDGLQRHGVCKYFAYGPMFRYERPQKGRYRQFHQLDVEIIGAPEPAADVEVIALGADLLRELGLTEGITLHLNSLGNPEDRAKYRSALVRFFNDHKSSLSEDSRERLERNPLRILDSKDAGDRVLVANAPLFSEFMGPQSRDFFRQVRDGLDVLNIAYQIDETLVRGLDYYTHTSFEFISSGLGAQATVIGGGRYDGLIEAMGGAPTPGIGFAAGIERLAMLIAEPSGPARPIVLIPMGEDAERLCLRLARQLRTVGLTVDSAYRGNLKKRLQRANKQKARMAVIIGENELVRGEVTLRDMDTGEQSSVSLNGLVDHLVQSGSHDA